MVLNELIKRVECVVEHECAKKRSIRCAVCEVDFHYICKEPIKLTCNHHICENCSEKNEQFYECKQHGPSFFADEDHQTNNLIKLKAKELFDVLRQDFEKTLTVFEDNKVECDDSVRNMVLAVKDNVDLRVETMKEQIDKLRNSLFEKVDEAATVILEKFKFEDQIKKARDDLKQLNNYVEENESMLSIYKLYEFQEELRKSISDIQTNYDTKFTIEFDEGYLNLSEYHIGRVSVNLSQDRKSSDWHVQLPPVIHSGIDLKKIELKHTVKFCSEKIESLHYMDNDLVAVQKRLKIDIYNINNKHDRPVQSLDFASNEIIYIPTRKQLLASPMRGHFFKIWNINSFECREIRTLGFITAFGVLEDETLVCGEGIIVKKKLAGFNISLWRFDDLFSLRKFAVIKNAHKGRVACFEALPGVRFVSASEDSTCKIWSGSHRLLATLKIDYAARCLKLISPKFVVIHFVNNQFMVFDLTKNYRIAFESKEEGGFIIQRNKSIAVTPNGHFLMLFGDCLKAFHCNSLREVSCVDTSALLHLSLNHRLSIEYINNNRFMFSGKDAIEIYSFLESDIDPVDLY